MIESGSSRSNVTRIFLGCISAPDICDCRRVVRSSTDCISFSGLPAEVAEQPVNRTIASKAIRNLRNINASKLEI